jgi:predicted amidohydrolase
VKLKIAAAQMKFRPTIRENVSEIIELIQSASGDGADAILFPECAVTGYRRKFNGLKPDLIEEGCEAIARAAREANCSVLVGSPMFRNGKWFNSLLIFDRRGRKVFQYSKIHLTVWDTRFFTPGNSVAFFHLEGIPCTAIICHERRYPELVRLPVMLGARIVFHPNAGLDSLQVSRTKRRGRDGIAVRAFENQIYYVFANTVGQQGDGLWSAGDSKIVAPDSRVLELANNRDEMIIQAELDLTKAGRKYAKEALRQPFFLRDAWQEMLTACKSQLRMQR